MNVCNSDPELYFITLATLEVEQDFIFFTEPSYPENAPLSLYLYGVVLFLPLQPWVCTLAGPRACPRDCNECRHMGEVQYFEGIVNYNSLIY